MTFKYINPGLKINYVKLSLVAKSGRKYLGNKQLWKKYQLIPA